MRDAMPPDNTTAAVPSFWSKPAPRLYFCRLAGAHGGAGCDARAAVVSYRNPLHFAASVPPAFDVTGLLEHALVRDATPALQLAALEALLEAAGAAPAAFAARYGSRLPWLRGFLSHTDAAGQAPLPPLSHHGALLQDDRQGRTTCGAAIRRFTQRPPVDSLCSA